MDFTRAESILRERHEAHIKLGLERVAAHFDRLGRPDRKFAVVHVAGTNGKGSTSAMLAKVLERAGFAVGLYTSPHLLDVRERIRVGGRAVPEREFADSLAAAVAAEEGNEPLSYFELVTAAALHRFAARGVDIAVLETGLGGRLDATNAVERPVLSLITRVDRDHQEWLGETLAEIAREKKGILREGVPALSAAQEPQAAEVLGLPPLPALRHIATRWDDGVQVLRDAAGVDWECGLLGGGQGENAALVLAAVDELRRTGWDIPERAVREGLRRPDWPGRFDRRARPGGWVLLDGLHNPGAAEAFVRTWTECPWREAHPTFLLGFLADKDWKRVLKILQPHLDRVVVTEPPSPRALPAAELAAELRVLRPDASIRVAPDTGAAARGVWEGAFGHWVVAGSFYLVGAVLAAHETEGAAA